MILQARSATPRVIRGPGDAVVFARRLSTGNAWRAAMAGLTVDAGSPASVEVFVAGVSRDRLPQPRTALSTIAAGSTADAG